MMLLVQTLMSAGQRTVVNTAASTHSAAIGVLALVDTDCRQTSEPVKVSDEWMDRHD